MIVRRARVLVAREQCPDKPLSRIEPGRVWRKSSWYNPLRGGEQQKSPM